MPAMRVFYHISILLVLLLPAANNVFSIEKIKITKQNSEQKVPAQTSNPIPATRYWVGAFATYSSGIVSAMTRFKPGTGIGLYAGLDNIYKPWLELEAGAGFYSFSQENLSGAKLKLTSVQVSLLYSHHVWGNRFFLKPGIIAGESYLSYSNSFGEAGGLAPSAGVVFQLYYQIYNKMALTLPVSYIHIVDKNQSGGSLNLSFRLHYEIQ